MAEETRPKRNRPFLNPPAEAAVEAPAEPVAAPAPVAPEKPAKKATKAVAATPTTNTTPPRRGTVAKPPKTAAKEPMVIPVEGTALTVVEVEGKKRYVVDTEPLDPTKRYAKFQIPEGSGMLGTIYLPPGAVWCRVAFGFEASDE